MMRCPTRSKQRPALPSLRRATTLLLFVCAPTAGCYDAESLIRKAQEKRLSTRLEEVELGVYRTTLPRDADSMATVTLQLDFFGNIAKKDVPAATTNLEEASYLLRHRVLVAVRESTAEDFAEPALTAIRKRVLEVANGLVDGATIQSIGIKAMSYLED